MPGTPQQQKSSCKSCQQDDTPPIELSMAFQPLVRLKNRDVFGYEALVRGINNESAWEMLSQVNSKNLYKFDQSCRVKAIQLASQLGLERILSINFMPNAVYRPELCIRTTLEAVEEYGFNPHLIMFEFTETEQMQNTHHVAQIVNYYQKIGFKTAMDDFGAGYSGLAQLADFQTDFIKLDMGLIRDIDTNLTRQAIARHLLALCKELKIEMLAEGVETQNELDFLVENGVDLFQGYLFAKPAFEQLPSVKWP